jgi:DNA repair exonuclease SbcCD nuclease subunit
LTLRAQASAREVPRVLVYHGSVTGARINDQPRSLLGDISLEPEDLQGWSYVAMGHIHQQQELAPGAWYSGSIDRCSFGEELEPKGVLRVTLGAQMQCEVSTLDPGALQYRTLEYLDLIKVRDSHPTDAEAAGKGFEAETVYRVKDKLNPADASEARRLIGAYQEAGVWIADAVTVVEDARVRDEDATGQEDNRTFLRRWLSRQDLDPIAASAGITADQLIEDVVKLHDELEDAA